MNVEKIRIVKNGKRYKRVVIPNGYERCEEVEAARDGSARVTWGYRLTWERALWYTANKLVRTSRPIYIRYKAQP